MPRKYKKKRYGRRRRRRKGKKKKPPPKTQSEEVKIEKTVEVDWDKCPRCDKKVEPFSLSWPEPYERFLYRVGTCKKCIKKTMRRRDRNPHISRSDFPSRSPLDISGTSLLSNIPMGRPVRTFQLCQMQREYYTKPNMFN